MRKPKKVKLFLIFEENYNLIKKKFTLANNFTKHLIIGKNLEYYSQNYKKRKRKIIHNIKLVEKYQCNYPTKDVNL